MEALAMLDQKRDAAVVLRMARVLQREFESQRRKSYSGLANLIAEANAGHEDRKIDRRKLKRLIDGEAVSLTLSELLALDAFLTPLGEGLSDKPLFERPTLVRSLVENAHVTLVLGAYARAEHRRNDLSRWDVRSMVHVLRAIEKLRSGTQVDVDDVLSEAEAPETPPCLGESGPSVCSIGSPRACHATEIMLAEMFGVKPFEQDSTHPVPFRFVWSPKASVPRASSFQTSIERIRSLDAELASDLLSDKARGVLQVEDRLYPDRSGPDVQRWISHGIVAVQRRANGHVWMACAGLTGPATYACAAAAAGELTGAVPAARSRHSPVRWDVIECTIQSNPGIGGDPRDVTSQHVVDSGSWPAAPPPAE
jgi:hypothetical protein